MIRRSVSTKKVLTLSLALLALATLGWTLAPGEADALGGGCAWDRHTEIDYFDNPQLTGPPVGWIVRTCLCNVYSEGETTPYFTTIAETPCP